MTVVRQLGGLSAADTVAVHVGSTSTRTSQHRWTMKHAVLISALALLGVASSASGLILTGGPVYSLPGGGSCVASGVASQTGGSTITCTGVNLGAHTKVYFGTRNDLAAIGNTMTGVNPAPATTDVFRYFSSTGTSITYTSTTTINDFFHGSHSVTSRLVLTLVSGSASIVATGGNPVNNNNGDVERVFQLTSGTSFTFRADVQASDAFFGLGQACPAVYDPSHSLIGAGGDRSRVDVGFYFSDCGDSVVDSPEQCDEGVDNGTPGSCCDASCQFRSSIDVCRPGGGAPCDLNETCSGFTGTCPPDDAPINGSNNLVCRPGSGDSCDTNEECSGVPGVACPPDDAPGNMGVVCRAASVGDICDMDELCSGDPGETCPPDDAPGQINVVCRPGSGDVCDPDERCTGIANQGCPPDVVSNPSTVCRVGSGDSCDPNENCTAIPTQPCPPNVITPMGTQCRAAAGVCDVAEQCTGVGGQTCPPNGFASASTPCNTDNDVCTVDACNGSGACTFGSNLDCDDGNVCSQDSCDPINGCDSTGTPSNSCVAANQSTLKVKNKTNDASDGVKFIWKGGPALVSNMGDPLLTTRYELCIYDNTGLQMAMGVPPGAGWAAVGPTSSPTGFKYKDSSATNDGIRIIKLKGSNLGKARAKVTGKGPNLPDLATLPFQYPVTAQLYASDGMCWSAEFNQAQTRANDLQQYKAKAP